MAATPDSLVDEGRDRVPLLMQTLLNRGALVQPQNRIVTKTASGYLAVTFAEHQARSCQLASALTLTGFQLGDRIGTLMWNNAWHLQCTHAIGCVGAVVHTLNARLAPQDLAYILQDADDRLIFVDAALIELLGSLDPEALQHTEQIVCCGTDSVPGAWTLPSSLLAEKVVDFEDFLTKGSPGFVWPSFAETTPYYLCYTSGSTSNPKGVVYSHRSMYLATMTMGLTDQYGISGSMIVCPFVPMFHIFSWGVPLVTLMLGAKTIFSNQFTSPEDFLDTLFDWEVQWTAGVPPIWQRLREAILARGIHVVRHKLRLCKVLSGGSAPSAEVMDWYHTVLGVEFSQGWGMTETNPLGTNAKYVNTYRDRFKNMSDQHSNLKRAGIPVPGFECRIANPNDLDQDMPNGEVGEFLVRGALVITKYFRQEAPDDTKFHKGWLMTGDMARVDATGEVVIADRAKDFIKSGGEWISSAALESSISNLAGVSLVAVVGVPHPSWDERPIAIISLQSGAESNTQWTPVAQDGVVDGHASITEHVRTHCAQTFAKFQLPDDVLLWDSIPVNSTGKIDKKGIRAQLAKEGYTLPALKASMARL